jgi:hypothetical protein
MNGEDKLLLSDSSCRMDYNLIKIKQFEEAETYKHEMEELQRLDKKNRNECEKRRTGVVKK